MTIDRPTSHPSIRSTSLDLKQLRYVVQIADCGSVSKAAELLRIAQPSLSLQLKLVEQELGAQLLVRHPRGVTLTDQGKTFVECARRILQDMDQIPQIMRSAEENPRGHVTVGLPMSACGGLCRPLVEAAARHYPGIRLHVVEAMSGYLEEWIQSGKLDVALLYDHRAYENVAWTEMMTEDLFVIAGAKSPFARYKKIQFGNLSDFPLVLPGHPNILRRVLERLASKLDFEIKADLDCDSLSAIVQLVRAGYVTILPSFALSEEIQKKELKAIPLVNPTPSWTLSVVLSKISANPHCGRAITKLLAETIRTMVQNQTWNARLG